MTAPGPKPVAKPATPAAPKPAAKPEPLIELVEIADRRLALALLVVGIALGAIVVYLALNLVIEDTES